MILTDLMSQWANIIYGGCRYRRKARAEMLRKYSVLHEYFRERGQESIFKSSLGEEGESYVLLYLTTDQCTRDRKAPYKPLAICGWGELQGSSIPVQSSISTEKRMSGLCGPARTVDDCELRSWSGC